MTGFLRNLTKRTGRPSETGGMSTPLLALLATAAVLAGCASPPAADVPPPASEIPSAAAASVSNQPPLKVGVFMDNGSSGIGAMEWCRLVNASPEMDLTLLDGGRIRAGGLDNLDLLVMPGGDSKAQYRSLGKDGAVRLKAFLRDGGGYIGTCAGCAILLDEPDRRLRLIPWSRSGYVDSTLFLSIDINDAGAKALGLEAGPNHKFRYHAGPFLQPTTNRIDGADFALWGTFAAEANLSGRVDKGKKMFGAGAIVGGTYGKGRVFATAVHPEYFESTRYLVAAAFRWVAGREVTFPVKPRRPGALAVGFHGVKGVASARALLALDAEDDIDLLPVDNGTIESGGLDHLDVLVSTSSKVTDSAARRDALTRFTARGGTVVACGVKDLDAIGGGIVCKSSSAILPAIRKLYPKDGNWNNPSKP